MQAYFFLGVGGWGVNAIAAILACKPNMVATIIIIIIMLTKILALMRPQKTPALQASTQVAN